MQAHTNHQLEIRARQTTKHKIKPCFSLPTSNPGWWYVSLVLQDIAMRNLHDINRGRYLILLPWRFPGSQVFMLATYIANSVLPVSPSPTYFHTDTTKELPTSNNTPLTRTGSSIPIPLPQLLPLGRRHLVPSPPWNLPFFFARDTSIQSIKMALRI